MAERRQGWLNLVDSVSQSCFRPYFSASEDQRDRPPVRCDRGGQGPLAGVLSRARLPPPRRQLRDPASHQRLERRVPHGWLWGLLRQLDSDNMTLTNGSNIGLMRNYATVSMDSGHWGASLADGRWAYNNLVGKFDWGQRAVTMTARVTKSIIQNYYGKPSSKSYFNGCSTGGRMAHMEAWKISMALSVARRPSITPAWSLPSSPG